MAEGLKEKTVKGLGWSLVDNLAGSGITFIVGLVLARLLSPEEFGVIGILMIFIAISNSIIDSGFSNALIRKPVATEDDYNTAFYINLMLGVVMYLVMFVSAPGISVFFKSPIVAPTLRVLSIVLILNAFGIIQRTLLVRKVDFKSQAVISLAASIISGVVGIGMALSGYGVWSLVGQQLSRQLVNTLLLWGFSHWRPARLFSTASFHELFGFGSKLLISGLIDTIYNNIYQFVIGKFFSKADLGQYTRAQQFQTIFSSNLTAVIQRVSYPVLSSIQDEGERLKMAYQKVMVHSIAISSICLLGLAAIAQPLIVTLIGEKWMPAVEMLQIICVSGMLYPLHALNLNILQVKGRSDLFLKLEIIKKFLGVMPVVLGLFYGIRFMLIGSVVTGVISFFINSYYSKSLINYSSLDQVKDMLCPLLISFTMAVTVWSLTLLDWPYLTMLMTQLITGAVMLLVLYYIFNRSHLLEAMSLVRILTAKFHK